MTSLERNDMFKELLEGFRDNKALMTAQGLPYHWGHHLRYLHAARQEGLARLSVKRAVHEMCDQVQKLVRDDYEESALAALLASSVRPYVQALNVATGADFWPAAEIIKDVTPTVSGIVDVELVINVDVAPKQEIFGYRKLSA